MKQRDEYFLRGRVKYTFRDALTGEIVETKTFDNLIVTTGRNEFAKGLTPGEEAAKITAIALGSGTNVPSLGDTSLQTEVIRKSGVNVTVTRSGNEIFCHAFFGAMEANFIIRELGLLAGELGDILISRAPDNTTKNNTRTLTVEWTLTAS